MRVAVVRAYTGAPSLPGIGVPGQIVPACEIAEGAQLADVACVAEGARVIFGVASARPQRGRAARPPGDYHARAGGPPARWTARPLPAGRGPAAPRGRRSVPGRSAPRIAPATRR